MAAFLRELSSYLLFLADFLVNFVKGATSLFVHLAGNFLEIILLVVPLEAFFFIVLYFIWQKMENSKDNESGSFGNFVKTNKWVKISVIVLTLAMIAIIAEREGYLQGLFLSAVGLYD